MTRPDPFGNARRKSLRSRGVIALAAFVAAVVVTLLAPFVHPVADALVCSAQGIKVVEQGGLPSPAHDHAAHCPLCMPAGAPPPTAFATDIPSLPTPSFVAVAMPVARRTTPVGAPLPPRGPPLVS